MNSSLNHIYSVVWNASLGLWQVASEVVRRGGKTQSEQRKNRKSDSKLKAAAGLLLVGMASPGLALAQLPTGGQVVGGQASIVQNGSALNITQSTDRAAIDWQTFNVGQGNSVNFVQPTASSIALNRVLGSDVSVIQGAINANGQVFLVNQNGILFTPTAQVNVGGIVASTQSISTADFMAGKYTFSGSSTGTVENQGSITTAQGGTVALIAAKIINTGTITAPQGTVGLAAGNTVTLDLGGPVKIQVTEGALNAEITQGGAILADGGQIFLTAKSAGNLTASVINHTGISRALSMAQLAGLSTDTASATPVAATPAAPVTNVLTGEINLLAELISQHGTLNASGTTASTQGGKINLNAGLIIDSGATVADGTTDGGGISMQATEILQTSAAKVSASGQEGKGGRIQITGGSNQEGRAYLSGTVLATGRRKGGEIDATAYNLTLAGATLDSSGTGTNATAGTQRIGGGWQGNDTDIINAVTTMLSGNTTLSNEGLDGMVVVWSDGSTTYGATLNARGSDVEISGKENLSANLDGVAAKTLLLDPKNIMIVEEISASSFNALTLANVISNGPGSETDDFGQQVLELANGKFVVTAPNASITSIFGNRANVGRVYVFDKTGQIFAILTGDIAGSKLGSGGVVALKGNNANNFVINSPEFSRSANQIASGAVTWFNSNTGRLASNTIANKVDGSIINNSNSLVGFRSGDRVGSGGITALSNGNYVVASPDVLNAAGNGARGAVTWMNGLNGIGSRGQFNLEVVSNSLVGVDIANRNDRVGSGGVFEVSGALPGTVDYVVSSPDWSNGRGAVTRLNGTDGSIAGTVDRVGVVGSTNSVIGITAGDKLSSGGVVALSDGSFVYISPDYNFQPAATLFAKAGAVHWVAQNRNPVGSANIGANAGPAIYGAASNDRIGSGGVTALSNGAFVVNSPEHNGQRGAVTWLTGSMLNGSTVSIANSLAGIFANDRVGSGGIIKLSDGNYVVNSHEWNSGAGAVTWVNGSNGKIFGLDLNNGTVSSTSSLVGFSGQNSVSGANAETGQGGVLALANGRYVVVSPKFDDIFAGPVPKNDVGAVTWSDSGGIAGFLSPSNSLFGNAAFDEIGSGGAVALTNGNFVIGSSGVDAAGKVNSGLVAVINGSQRIAGNLVTGSFTGSQMTRLAGSNADDFVGGVSFTNPGERTLYALNNGNVVVANYRWRLNTGAVTWLSGSLSGDTATTSISSIDATNSLIGSISFDKVGFSGNNQPSVVQISDTQYAVVSSEFGNSKGAVTFVNATNGIINGTSPSLGGTVNSQNSIIGTVNDQRVGTNSDGAQRVFQLGTLGADSKIAVVNSGFAPGGGVLITDGKFVQATGTPGSLTDDFGQFNGESGKGGENSSILRSTIINALNNGTAVTLKANNDITVQDAVVANSNATGALSLLAGRNINFNANVNTGNGNLTAIAGATGFDPQHRDAGDSTITLATGVTLNAGTGTISLVANNVGNNIGKFVNNAGATPFTAAKTFIYLPSFNTTGNNAVTHATLGGLTLNGKRYSTTFNSTTGAPQSSLARLDNLTGVNLLYAATPTITVTPAKQTVVYGEAINSIGFVPSGTVDGDTLTDVGIGGTPVFGTSGEVPLNGLRNAGQYNVTYESGLTSSMGYAFADASAQTDDLVVTPRALTVITNNFLGNTTDTLTVTSFEGLVRRQEFNGLKLIDNVLSTSFGENTLASNYATTVVVPGAAANDLTVNRPLTFNGLNLTLQSDKNINIRNTITAQGANDKVNLRYGQGAVAANNTADFNFGLSPEGFAGKLNLQAGNNFSTTLGSDGVATNYLVITALGEQGSTTGTDLQGINGNLTGNFALGADINAAPTSQWNNGLGFEGIGGESSSVSTDVEFAGRFTGLGHTISELTIKRPNQRPIGLFDAANKSTVRDIGVSNAIIQANSSAGVLIGKSTNSTIRQVFTSGTVNTGSFGAGGLIGQHVGGVVNQAFSNSTVSGSSSVGGLIGLVGAGLDPSRISEVFAGGAVTSTGSDVGGLAGTVSVQPNSSLTLTDAYSTAKVTGGGANVGGLLGGVSSFGNLVIDNTYATGLVTVQTSQANNAGGLIGGVTVSATSGPFVGQTGTVQFSDSFFDTITTAQTNAVGTGASNINLPQGSNAAVGKTTDELKLRATFMGAGWNITGSGGALPVLSFGRSATVWTIGALQIPVTVTFNALTGQYTYKASEYALSELFSTSSLFAASCEVCSTTWKLGTDYTFSFDNKTVTGFTDAGTYNNIGVKVLNQDYALAETGNTLGTLTIDRARITGVTGIAAVSKTYDGKTTAELNTSGAKFTGILQNETGILTVATATGAFANKNVGDNKTVNITGITLGGTAAKNYVLDNSGTTTIPGFGITGMPTAPIIVNVPNTANTATATANITRLASVTWVGGATGNWFDAANWAGGAVPDLANVASVVLPANVKVTFNGAMDAVMIDTLGSLGAMDMSSGTLSVGTGGITLAGLNQTGGKLSSTGNLSVNQLEGPIQLGDLTVGGTMTVKTNGAISQLANTALTVTGTASVDAGANDVTLANANNDFNSIAVTAKDASITDKNAVALDSIKAASLAVKAGGAVTQVADKAIEVTGATSVDAGANDVTLANANNDFNSIALTAKDASITDKNAVALDSIKAASLAVKAGGAVTQVANTALTVTGTASVDAGANDVTLANANNDFNSIAVTAKDASITDKNAVALDSIKAASLAVKAGGAVTQVADKAIEVTGATSVDAGANDVTLANANNDFNSIALTAKDASITDKNAVALDSIKAASLAVKAGGAVTQVADKAIEVTGVTSVDAGANDVTLGNAGNDFNSVAITAKSASVVDKNAVALDSIKAASLAVKAGGAVTQVVDKAIEVTGATSVDAGNNDVTLGSANNDFNSVSISAKSASVTDKNAVALDSIKAASLAVKAGGAVTQVADKAIEVTGATSVDAGANDVTLGNAGNDFNSVAITAKSASVVDKNAVALDSIKAASLAVKAGGAVTQVADKAIEVTGTTSVDAGANDVTLANANNDFNSIAVTAKAASINDKNVVVLDSIKAASLAVKAGGAVTQVADKAIEVTGATSVDAGNNDVTLANANNDFNSIALTAKDASITDKNAVALDSIKAASLAVKAGGAVTQVVDKAIEVTGATSVDAGNNDVTLANANNDFNSIALTAKDASITDKNAVALDSIKAASLAVKAGGAVTQVVDKAIEVTGATSVDAGANDVTLANAGNDFNSVAITAKSASVVDKNAVALDSIKAASLAVKAGGAVTQVADKAIEVTGATSVDAGANDVTLANANNDFNSIALTAKDASITDKNAVALDSIKAASLAVKAGGAVTQVVDKAIEVTGATSVDAGANDVTLANAGNDFNSVAITAKSASVVDKNAVALDSIKAASLAVKAGGAVTQVADKAIEVTGATSVDAGANDVTLANANNDFNSIALTAKDASITDKNAVALDSIKAASLAVKAGGAVTQVVDKAIEVTGVTSVDAGANDVTLANANNDFNSIAVTAKAASIADKNEVALDSIKAASLNLKAGGAVTQVADKVIEVTGATSVDAGVNDVTLGNANNDFNSIAVTAKSASIADKNAVALDTIKAASLDLKAGGAVTQVADNVIEVTGATSVDAGNNDVTLANANNDFNSIAVTAKAASITDKNEVALDTIKAASLNVKAGGAVTQVADKAIEVTGTTSVDAGNNDVTLANANNDFNSIAVTAKAASITDKNAVALDTIKAASLAVKAGGAVTQVADKAIEVTGATSVDAGNNDVTLANANNDFNSIAVTAKAASITDKNAVALDTIKAASLAVKAGGAVTQVADKAIEVTGATSVDAGNNDVTLANANNDFNSIAVTAKSASIADKNAVALDTIKAASLAVKAGGAVTQVADKAIEVTGATSVDAGANDVTLANANNDFNSVAITAKSASVVDKNAVALDTIKAASLNVKAGGAVTQVADKAIEVTGATSVDAGNNDVTLANANNDFNSIAVTAKAASINDKNAVALDTIKAASLNVKAGGAVTQVADKAIEVTGATSVDAGANDVTLANANNDFNSIAVTAKAASIADKNEVALDSIKAASLNLKAGGAVTQVADKVIEVTGATSVDAGVNDVTLGNANNDFNSIAVTAKSASIADKNAVALDTIKAASLDLKAGGAVTQVADNVIEVTGATSVDAGNNDVTLANANNDFNSIAVTAKAASITDKNEVALDTIKAASLSVKTGGVVTQLSDKVIEVTGATSVNAGTNDVTLTNANNDFGSIGVTAGAASINDKNAVTMDGFKVATLAIKADGPIDQTLESALLIAGPSSFDGSETIVLPNLDNRFGGPISLRGTDVNLGSDAQIRIGERNIRSLELQGAPNRIAAADSLARVAGVTQVGSSNQTASAPATSGPDSITLQQKTTEIGKDTEPLLVFSDVALTVPAGKVLVIDGGIRLPGVGNEEQN